MIGELGNAAEQAPLVSNVELILVGPAGQLRAALVRSRNFDPARRLLGSSPVW